jgi:hypothetical protein
MKRAYSDISQDRNLPGLRVCNEGCNDERDPWRLPAIQTENIALRFPRPDVSIATGPIGGNQLVTNGNPNETFQYDSFFITQSPYKATFGGAPGDISLGSGAGKNVAGLYPTLGGITPKTGSQAGGTPVLISGTHLNVVTDVKFGGISALFTIISPIQISTITPAYAITGKVNVEVIAPFGTATLYGEFTYT